MTTHTEGRLKVVEERGARPAVFISEERGGSIAKLYNRMNWQNDARRLTACWNALIAFPTETIERCEVDLVAMARERDELIEALREARQHLGGSLQTNCGDSECRVCSQNRETLARYDAVLAKHSPKAPA